MAWFQSVSLHWLYTACYPELPFMSINLKRLVKLLTGAGFKGETAVYAMSG
jgi:hypothetical protein